MAIAGAHLNILNIQVMANEQMALDKAAGTYDSNLAEFDKYYFAFGEHQVQPFSYTTSLVDNISAVIPAANTFRIGFNDNAFDANGNLHPQYEAFIQDSIDNNINLIFNFAGHGGGFVGRDGDMTSSQIESALSGECLDKLKTGWDKFGDWLAKNPDVKDNIVGLEILNEPASYDRAADLAAKEGNPDLAHFTDLYASHMAEVGKIIDDYYQGDIYINAWGWSGDLKPLTTENDQGVSAIEKLQNAFGDDLVWSMHHYPGWAGLDEEGRAERIDWWEDQIALAGDSPIVLTETNNKGAILNDTENDHSPEFHHGRMFDWFADQDIGLGWFPGENTGKSGLIYVSKGGNITIRHQDSYAAAMNGFTSDSDHEGTGGLQLIDAALRNEETASDYNPDAKFDPVAKMGVGVGGHSNDVITGSAEANNFLFGQDGNDSLTGSVNDDFLYGQDGNDTLSAAGKIAILDGGQGDDTLNFLAGEAIATGGTGADDFRAAGAENITICDFDAATDMLSVGDLFKDINELKAAISVTPGNTEGHPGDLVINAPDGTKITMLHGGNLASNPENWVEEFLVDKEPGGLDPDDIPKAPVEPGPEDSPGETHIDEDDGGSGGAGAAMAGLGLAGAVLMALSSGGGMF